MEFNYGLERKRFEREWNKLRQQYRKAGMDENAINEMYAFDLEIFNDSRAIAKHEQPITPDMSGDNEDKSTLFEKFKDQLSYQDSYVFIPQRYAWLGQIGNYFRIFALMILSLLLCMFLKDTPTRKSARSLEYPSRPSINVLIG